MALEEVNGIVLFHRKHREKDYLVKIFTEEYGKIMFFVRGSKNPNWKLKTAIQPFVYGRFIADIRSEGLSFLRESKDLHYPQHVYTDIFKNAYITYILALADAAVEDRHTHQGLFRELIRAVQHIDSGKDPEIITNILEIRLMYYFGVSQEWRGCVICGEIQGNFDYSSKYNGLLCDKHWYLDPRRFQLSQRTVYFLRLFSRVTMKQVDAITISKETKKELRSAIDKLYEENVGIHLKSKHFIDSMSSWEDIMKNDAPSQE